MLTPGFDVAGTFAGTAIRLPLRTNRYSELNPVVVFPHAIHDLLASFIHDELRTVMVFLRHVKIIVVKEVDERGNISILATARLHKSEATTTHGVSTRELSVTTTAPSGHSRSSWLAISCVNPVEPFARELETRLGHAVTDILVREKLTPDIALAVPIDGIEHVRHKLGCLYTFLPLPVRTGFPCLVNAVFSLTPDRQSLRNPEEHTATGSLHQYVL